MTELTYQIGERRICWPHPDATCLNGGCGHCDGHPFRKLSTIERFARSAGMLNHRGRGEDDALHAYQVGLDHGFYNVETRASKADVTAYAESLGSLALRALADGMTGGTHGATKAKVLPWLLRYRRATLDESFRLSQRAGV